MRRKKRRRYSLETIVLALIFLPPLGFFFLWRSSRTWRGRIAVAAAFVVFLGLAAGVFFKSGAYSRMRGTDIPSSGFDITHNSRGRYVTQRILPFEWTIFNEVVWEMRRIQPEYTVPDTEIMSLEMVQPEAGAFEIVANRRGLDYRDVKGIYLKVTTQLAKTEKKK